MKNTIGQQLNAIRRDLCLSQKELAVLSGVPIATLQRMLGGGAAKEESMKAVARAMGYKIVLSKDSEPKIIEADIL